MTKCDPRQIIASQCGRCNSTNEDIDRLICHICKFLRPLQYAILGGPIDPIIGREWWAKEAYPMDPKTPPRQRKEEGKSNTPSTDTTKLLPLPCRCQLAKLDKKYYNDLCHMHLRRCIGKIKELQTGVIEGYGKYYKQERGEPLPEKVKTKIELLFQHCIECRCAEMNPTVEEEKQWNSKDSKVTESDLSSSSEEEEEHDMDEFTFAQTVAKKKKRIGRQKNKE